METKVLILEDEDVLGKLYKKKLKNAHFNVLWINSINKIQEIVQEFKPNIVLLDNSISGEEKSGIDIIPNIREILPNTKIIMLSNYSDFHLRDKAIKSGANDYLVKIDTPPNKLVKYLNQYLI